MATREMPARLLAIDGGGVHGLLALLMLEQIMDLANKFRANQRQDPQDPWQMFDLIAGINTGGLIAILLGRMRLPIKEAIERYKALSGEAFTPNNLIDNDPQSSRAFKFKSASLKTALKAMLNGDRDKNLLQEEDDTSTTGKVFVVSYRNGGKGEAKLLRSYPRPSEGQGSHEEMNLLQAASATSAASSFFDSVMVHGIKYGGDGALFGNPVDLIHAEGNQLFGDGEQILVSLGTGTVSNWVNIEGDQKLQNVAAELSNVHLKADEIAATFLRSDDGVKVNNEGRYFRFDVPSDDAQVLAESETQDFSRLSSMAMKYVEDPKISEALSTCCAGLTGSWINALANIRTGAGKAPSRQHFLTAGRFPGALSSVLSEGVVHHGQQSDTSVNVGEKTTEGHTGANDGQSHFAQLSSMPETSNSIPTTTDQPDLQSQWTRSHEGVAQHPAQESDSLPPQNVPHASGNAGPRSRGVGPVRQVPFRDRSIRSRDQQSYQSAANATTTQRVINEAQKSDLATQQTQINAMSDLNRRLLAGLRTCVVQLGGTDIGLDQSVIDLLRAEAPQVLSEYETRFQWAQNSRQNWYELPMSSNIAPDTQQNPAPILYGGEQAYMPMPSSTVYPAQQGTATISYGPQQDPQDGMHQNTLAALSHPTAYPTQHSQHPPAPSNQFFPLGS